MYELTLPKFQHMPSKFRREIDTYYRVRFHPVGGQHGGDPIANKVAAWVRHNLTPYDHYLKQGYGKECARAMVQATVSNYLTRWR